MGNILVESSVTKAFQPDIARFNIHIGKVDDNSRELTQYNKTVIDAIINGMTELDIEEENLSETYFRICVNREYKDEQYVDNGFKLDSAYAISTYLDYELMDSIREMLVDLELEFSIDYLLEDEKDIRATLLADAVKSSRMKAEIIAGAADREVGELVAVRYHDNARRPMMLAARNMDEKDVAPRDIELTESVEVEWSIE